MPNDHLLQTKVDSITRDYREEAANTLRDSARLADLASQAADAEALLAQSLLHNGDRSGANRALICRAVFLELAGRRREIPPGYFRAVMGQRTEDIEEKEWAANRESVFPSYQWVMALSTDGEYWCHVYVDKGRRDFRIANASIGYRPERTEPVEATSFTSARVFD